MHSRRIASVWQHGRSKEVVLETEDSLACHGQCSNRMRVCTLVQKGHFLTSGVQLLATQWRVATNDTSNRFESADFRCQACCWRNSGFADGNKSGAMVTQGLRSGCVFQRLDPAKSWLSFWFPLKLQNEGTVSKQTPVFVGLALTSLTFNPGYWMLLTA